MQLSTPGRALGPRPSEAELSSLMARYQGGEAEAAAELVERLAPPLLRFLSAWPATPSDAEDLFQECWLRIHRSRHVYRAGDPLLPWVFAIARHTRLDWYRRRQRRDRKEVLVAEPPDVAASGPGLGAPGGKDVFEMLKALPESQREAILLLKVSGMSLEDVARATSSTVGSIKQKVHRAYEKLRRIAGRERH